MITAECSFDADADMYGIGIRLGFYETWFAGILASIFSIDEEGASNRFTMSMFISATFIALIAQTAQKTITPIDIYMALLMTFGYFYFLIPVLL